VLYILTAPASTRESQVCELTPNTPGCPRQQQNTGSCTPQPHPAGQLLPSEAPAGWQLGMLSAQNQWDIARAHILPTKKVSEVQNGRNNPSFCK